MFSECKIVIVKCFLFLFFSQMTTVGEDALLDGGSKPVLSNTEGDDDATRPIITKRVHSYLLLQM